MKHNPKLNDRSEDRCRVDVTFIRRDDPVDGTKGKVTRTNDIMLTLEEGKQLIKDLGGK